MISYSLFLLFLVFVVTILVEFKIIQYEYTNLCTIAKIDAA